MPLPASSSSGRGIRYVDAAHFTENVERWLRRLLAQQGSVMVEPYYQKVKDFGMEFTALPDGTVRYEGLSLFHTVNGAYTGNILATESVKRRMISRYVSEELLDAVREKIMSMPDLRGYSGPFGIDMMVVSDCRDGVASRTRQFLLHPCVEINLRRTMGHVALHLSPTDDDTCKVMRIVSGDHYKLSIRKAAWRAGL